jgi:hypothetical protein
MTNGAEIDLPGSSIAGGHTLLPQYRSRVPCGTTQIVKLENVECRWEIRPAIHSTRWKDRHCSEDNSSFHQTKGRQK